MEIDMKKVLLLLLLNSILLVFILTGCINKESVDSILVVLEDENIIENNWQHIDTLHGIGKNVGAEYNLPDTNKSYEIYQDEDENYICITISKDDTYIYNVYIYNNVTYEYDNEIYPNDDNTYYVTYDENNFSSSYRIKQNSVTKKFKLD